MMNSSTSLHQSSWGRIWLLSKIGFFSTLRNVLLFYGAIAIAFLGFPFLTYLIDTGNPLEAIERVMSSYRYGGLSSLFILTTCFYLLGWLNKLVHLSTPGAYTQLPTTAGEKLGSIGLLMLGYLALSIIISSLLTLLFSLGHTLHLGGEWRILFGLLSEVPARWLGFLSLFTFFPFLVVAFCMIQFKKPVVGMFVAAIFFLLLMNFVYVGLSELSDEPDLIRQISDLGEQVASYIMAILFFLLDVAMICIIHWRIKTLQLK